MGLLELLLVSVGLAMDAFAVSVCGSMVLSPENRFKGAMRFGIWFGAFQALMPLIGFYLGVSFADFVAEVDHWINEIISLTTILFGFIWGKTWIFTRGFKRKT